MKVRRNYLMFYTSLYTIFTLLALTFTVSVQAKDAAYDYSIYKYSLSSNELSVYTQIYDKAMAFDDRMFNLKAPLTEAELSNTMNCFFFDHPELYWLNTSYRYAINNSHTVVKLQLKFGIGPSEFANANTIFENQLNQIVTNASRLSSAVEKEKYIHDYICSNTVYDEDSPLNQSAYSALTSSHSVCAGYARAFQIACERVGIPCYYVTGTSKGVNHAWNIVCIDGNYYNVDLTWDDVIADNFSKPSYIYFNKNDAAFAADHTRSDYAVLLPACN